MVVNTARKNKQDKIDMVGCLFYVQYPQRPFYKVTFKQRHDDVDKKSGSVIKSTTSVTEMHLTE